MMIFFEQDKLTETVHCVQQNYQSKQDTDLKILTRHESKGSHWRKSIFGKFYSSENFNDGKPTTFDN